MSPRKPSSILDNTEHQADAPSPVISTVKLWEMTRADTLIFIMVIFSISSCGWFERFDNSYSSYSEATESQSWKGGWLPHLLPKDARNILESHYVDRSSVIVSFEFTEDFRAVLDAKCRKTEGHHMRFADMNASWWPNSLTGEAFGSSHEYYYYECRDDEFDYYAIPFGQRRAYFWRAS
jgi:hypothetical protein